MNLTEPKFLHYKKNCYFPVEYLRVKAGDIHRIRIRPPRKNPGHDLRFLENWIWIQLYSDPTGSRYKTLTYYFKRWKRINIWIQIRIQIWSIYSSRNYIHRILVVIYIRIRDPEFFCIRPGKCPEGDETPSFAKRYCKLTVTGKKKIFFLSQLVIVAKMVNCLCLSTKWS